MVSLGICDSKLTNAQIQVLLGELILLQCSRNEKANQPNPQLVTPSKNQYSQPAVSPDVNPSEQESQEPSPWTPWKRKRSSPWICPAPQTVFKFRQGNYTVSAVPIPWHKDEQSFQQYHARKPYVKDIVQEMGWSTESSDSISMLQGSTIILTQLAQCSAKEYIEVAKSTGLKDQWKLDAVGLATLKQDAGLKDWQVLRLLKHLRYAFQGHSVSVPYLKIKEFL